MKKDEFYLGTLKIGVASVLVTGFCYFIIAIFACFSPKSVASYIASPYYFKDFELYKNYFILLKYLMFISNLSMIGFVLSMYYDKGASKSPVFIFLTILAVIGLSIGLLQSILDATRVPHLAKEYEHSSFLIQHVIIAFGVSNPAIYMISLGLPGIWLIFLNLLMRKNFPLLLTLSGISWGIGSVITVIAHLFVLMPVIYMIAFVAIFGVPFWTFFQTNYFLKKLKTINH